MKKWKVAGIGILVVGAATCFARFSMSSNPKIALKDRIVNQKVEDVPVEVTQDIKKFKKSKAHKIFVTVTFLGANKKGDVVFKTVKRPYSKKDGSKLSFAIKSLINGPDFNESRNNIYSEIPSGVKLLSLIETKDKVTINFNDTFENGGGTNSIYERMQQLIKTANKNTKKPVYLQINGEQIDVIGGDGIMITQPLNDKSLGE